MPDSGDFARFAADVAPGLLRLASAMTGDGTTAERLVETALVKTFRSGPRTDRPTPRVKAYRALVAALPRERVPLRRLSEGLQLHDVSPSAALPPAPVTDMDELLWKAVRDLAPRHQLSLLLRCAAGLSRTETARVLRLPVMVADRLHLRALRELRLASDVGPDITELVDDDPGAAATAFEATVCQAIRGHVGHPDADVHRLLGHVRERTRSGGPTAYPSRVRAGALAVAVTSVVAAAVFVLSKGQGEDSPTVAALPPAPPGTQLVGYRRMAVAVPATWMLHESPCGRTAAPPRVTGPETDISCTGAPLSPSVILTDAPVNFPPGHPPPVRTSRVAGQVLMRTTVAHYNGIYQQAVFVFGARFMMIVRSPDQAVVSAISRSVRAVPDGYAVVPTCRSLPVREAVQALAAEGLTASITHTSSIPMWHGEPPVIFQSKPPGSIVRQGTRIALTTPGR